MFEPYHDSPLLWKDLLIKGLQEDGWPYDWTTLSVIENPSSETLAVIVAKSPGVWAASGLMDALRGIVPEISSRSENFSVNCSVREGESFSPGTVVSEWRGSARLILALERPFLNLASYVCGIASLTHQLVEKVREACPENTPRVTSTRKTLPGYRDLAIHGVRIGGGFSHRPSLLAGILIKENHIALAGGVAAALEGTRRSAPHSLRVEIEVRNLKEFEQALALGAEAILLDNFSPAQARDAVSLLRTCVPKPWIEISGGLNEHNIADYALAGVDVLSVGSLTHSVKTVDFSLLIEA